MLPFANRARGNCLISRGPELFHLYLFPMIKRLNRLYLICFFSLLPGFVLLSCTEKKNNKPDRKGGTPYINLQVSFGKAQTPVTIDSIICEEGMTVYSLLQQFPDQLQVQDTLYEGIGHLILGINGHQAHADVNWVYCINGAYATKAADAIVLEPGDEVAWHLTSESAPCK